MSVTITYIPDKKETCIPKISATCMNPDCGWSYCVDSPMPDDKFEMSVEARRHVRERGHSVHVEKTVVDMYREKVR